MARKSPPQTSQAATTAKLPKRDQIAELVSSIVNDSRRTMSEVAQMHQDALINSLGLSPMDTFVTADAPYGQTPSHLTDKILGDVVSPFTAEQVNAITTRFVAPLIGQREVLYVEAQGAEDIRKAAVRETLFDRAIRSPYTSWADLCWRTGRDVTVRSRSYWEIRPLKIERLRRVYDYASPESIQNLLDAGIPEEDVAEMAQTLRTSTVKPVTLWDGPVVRPLLYGSVHKERSETLISESTLCVVIEREMPWGQFLVEGKALFPDGVDIPFTQTAADRAANSGFTSVPLGGPAPISTSTAIDRTTSLPRIYTPVRFQEFRGINPLGAPNEEWIAWVSSGQTIGAKVWDGSGSVINIVEWCWDPVNGLASSSSPAMTLLSPQEMLSVLMNCAENAILWDSIPGGGINTDRVNVPGQVKNLKQGQWFNLQGTNADGPPLFPMELGKNAGAVLQFIGDMETRLRIATAAPASFSGGAPEGVGTLGEFAGIQQGAMDRIGTQLEINVDTALRRTFSLIQADWKDRITTDTQLQEILGQNEATLGATLADLEGEMDVIPMASRYHTVRQQKINAYQTLMTEARQDPRTMALLKVREAFKDFAYAVEGPASARWIRTDQELLALGIDPVTLEQQAVEQAASPGKKGTPSPPKDQPASGADMVTQQGATA